MSVGEITFSLLIVLEYLSLDIVSDEDVKGNSEHCKIQARGDIIV